MGHIYEERFSFLRRILSGNPFIAAFFIFVASLGMVKYSLLRTFLPYLASSFVISPLTVGSGRAFRGTTNLIIGTEGGYHTYIFGSNLDNDHKWLN